MMFWIPTQFFYTSHNVILSGNHMYGSCSQMRHARCKSFALLLSISTENLLHFPALPVVQFTAEKVVIHWMLPFVGLLFFYNSMDFSRTDHLCPWWVTQSCLSVDSCGIWILSSRPGCRYLSPGVPIDIVHTVGLYACTDMLRKIRTSPHSSNKLSFQKGKQSLSTSLKFFEHIFIFIWSEE